jgi:hypothetical protein
MDSAHSLSTAFAKPVRKLAYIAPRLYIAQYNSYTSSLSVQYTPSPIRDSVIAILLDRFVCASSSAPKEARFRCTATTCEAFTGLHGKYSLKINKLRYRMTMESFSSQGCRGGRPLRNLRQPSPRREIMVGRRSEHIRCPDRQVP